MDGPSADTPIMGGADMAQTKTFVGLDAHARKTQIATLDFESGELRNWTINGRPQRRRAPRPAFGRR